MSEEAFVLPRGGGCFIQKTVAEESERSVMSGLMPMRGASRGWSTAGFSLSSKDTFLCVPLQKEASPKSLRLTFERAI